MTKLLAISLVVAIVAGCDQIEESANTSSAWEEIGRSVYVKVATIKGHDYVIMNGYKQGGIIHAASCPCHKNSID